ncbi:MAG: hypothetical protein ACJ0QO_03020 [Parvicellaceae bacterium]
MTSIRLLSLIILLGLIVSCNKDQAISMHWDETGCSNPWDNFLTLDTFTTEAYHQGINDYLTSEGIAVNSISSELDSSKMEFCFACHCKTGKVITINIPKENKRKLKRLSGNNQFGLDFYY